MTTRQKTLYELLGVTKEADEKELKLAFRKLSKQLHPDINPADDAAERFQEVQEAYEVLTTPELRDKYDKQLARKDGDLFAYDKEFQDLLKTFFSKRREALIPRDGEDISVDVHVTAEQILRGATVTTRLKKSATCTPCHGNGIVSSKERCKKCEGKGGKMVKQHTPFGKFDTFMECGMCKGTGNGAVVTCSTCSGKGTLRREEDFHFPLEKTANFMTRLRFEGKGHEGKNGGRDGDLYVKLHQSPYDKVKVTYGFDLNEERNVPLSTVMSEEPYLLHFPDGDETEIKFNELQGGSAMYTFPERGFYSPNGNRGTYNLRLSIDIPAISKVQKKKILDILGGE